jgi:hypothetical protein
MARMRLLHQAGKLRVQGFDLTVIEHLSPRQKSLLVELSDLRIREGKLLPLLPPRGPR